MVAEETIAGRKNPGRSPDATRTELERRNVPVAAMVESIVGCKWSIGILALLAEGTNRPSGILRACPRLSAKVMNERLRKMTRFGIARRRVFGEKPPVEVEYTLTPFGLRFMGILDAVRRLQDAVDAGSAAEADHPRQKPRR